MVKDGVGHFVGEHSSQSSPFSHIFNMAGTQRSTHGHDERIHIVGQRGATIFVESTVNDGQVPSEAVLTERLKCSTASIISGLKIKPSTRRSTTFDTCMQTGSVSNEQFFHLRDSYGAGQQPVCPARSSPQRSLPCNVSGGSLAILRDATRTTNHWPRQQKSQPRAGCSPSRPPRNLALISLRLLIGSLSQRASLTPEELAPIRSPKARAG